MQVRPGRHPVGPSDDVDEVREKEEPPAGEEQAGQRERQSYEPVVVKVGAQAGAWPGLAALVDHACSEGGGVRAAAEARRAALVVSRTMTRPRRREHGGRAERTVIHSSRKRKGLVGERRELVQAPEACVCGEGRVLLRVRLHVGASVRSRSRSCRASRQYLVPGDESGRS